LRGEQLRSSADKADSGNKYTACQHLHFKTIGAGLDFLGTFFIKKKGSIKQPLASDHSL
jgi:hypothetical protein